MSEGVGERWLEQRLALVEHLADMRSFDRANQVLDEVAGDAMELPEFWRLRAAIADQSDDPRQAAGAARAGLQRFPHDVPLLVLLGRALTDLKQLADAEDVLLRALSEAPEHVNALCAYARVVALAGQTDKARRLLDRAASIDPDDVAPLVGRYHLAHLDGDDQETQRVAEQLARVTGGNPHAVAALGVEALKRGDVGTSQALLQRAARADLSVIDGFGPEHLRELQLLAHPLMWPLRPVHRFGATGIWFAAIALAVGTRALVSDQAALVVVGTYLVWCVYTWVVPPLLRRFWLGGRG